MAIPEGYEKLAVIGIAWKGEYASGTAYKAMNAVHYQGSAYVALRDSPTGPPAADNANWMYLARGFIAAMLSEITAVDTSGVLGTAGAEAGAQALIDALADKVMTKLVSKSQIVNNLLANTPGNALDAVQGKTLKDAVDAVNRDFVAAASAKPTSGFAVSSDSYICRNRVGDVEINLGVTAGYTGDWTTVAFTPAGYIPKSAKKLNGYVFANGNYNIAFGYVYPNGNIKVFAALPAGSYIFGLSGTYSINI